MRDLLYYSKKCMEMLDALGIEYGHITEFIVNTRAKKRLGQCKHVAGGYSININSVLLEEQIDESVLINTIIHELLHSCKGCMNHGNKWKSLSNKVYRKYGLNIKRTSSAEEVGMPEETYIADAKYIFKCKGCGKIIRRNRASKFTNSPQSYRCACCGGHFERIK